MAPNPEALARIQQLAREALTARAVCNTSPLEVHRREMGLRLLDLVVSVITEDPEMWETVGKIAEGDFSDLPSRS